MYIIILAYKVIKLCIFEAVSKYLSTFVLSFQNMGR
jgi:hypothetical protein